MVKQTRNRLNLGPVERIALGHAQCFVVGQEEIAVFRSREGKFFAIANQCPHRRGPLSEGVFGDGKVICPLHGHKFDLATGKGSDGGECVKIFHVWEEQGEIRLDY